MRASLLCNAFFLTANVARKTTAVNSTRLARKISVGMRPLLGIDGTPGCQRGLSGNTIKAAGVSNDPPSLLGRAEYVSKQ